MIYFGKYNIYFTYTYSHFYGVITDMYYFIEYNIYYIISFLWSIKQLYTYYFAYYLDLINVKNDLYYTLFPELKIPDL